MHYIFDICSTKKTESANNFYIFHNKYSINGDEYGSDKGAL